MRTSKRDAQRLLTQLLAEVDAGAHSGPDATFARLAETWIAARQPSWSPSTAAATDSYLRLHILPAIGATTLRQLQPAHLDQMYGQLGATLAPSSVAKVHSIVRAALEQACRWGWLPANPALRATPPVAGRPTVRPPEPGQVRRLLAEAEARDPAFVVYLTLAASTGARRGELCALRWSDVDLDLGEVTFARSMARPARGRAVERTTKTGRSRRVSLGDAATERLRAHRAWMEERATVVGMTLPVSAFVFSHSPGGGDAWRPDGVTTTFMRLRARVGADGVRLHDLRHYVATRLLGAGVDVRTVAGRLGHANASTTLNVYSHFLPSADRAAANLLDGITAGDQ